MAVFGSVKIKKERLDPDPSTSYESDQIWISTSGYTYILALKINKITVYRGEGRWDEMTGPTCVWQNPGPTTRSSTSLSYHSAATTSPPPSPAASTGRTREWMLSHCSKHLELDLNCSNNTSMDFWFILLSNLSPTIYSACCS